MENNEIEREIYFANVIIGAIDHVKTPMLMYEEEKSVTKKALEMYIEELESRQRGR